MRRKCLEGIISIKSEKVYRRKSVPCCVLFVVLLLGLLSFSYALDHDNLDENRPLRLEDAYPIAKGEVSFEGGVRVLDGRQGKTRIGFQPVLILGPAYNMQVEIGSDLWTEPRTIDGTEKSGDVRAEVLYNFNTETLTWPALAIKVGVEMPTGVQSKGVDAIVGGLLTRSFGRLRTHFNVKYSVIGSAQGPERNGIYRAAIGASYPIGYPMRFRETLIADVFTYQDDISGQRSHTGIEVGIRHQFSSHVIFDAGLGTEFSGPSDRSVVFGMVGASMGF